MNFLLVMKAMAREQARWAIEHLYVLLVLSPLVLGLTYLTFERLLSEVTEWQLPVELSGWLAVLCAACLIGTSVSRASAELYHLHRPEAFLEALPISPPMHFNIAFAIRAMRLLPAGLVAVVIHALINTEPRYAATLLPLVLFILLIAVAQLAAALLWIHWHHTRSRPLLLFTLLFLSTAVLTGLLLASVVQPETVLLFINKQWLIVGALLWSVMLYFVTLLLHERWRAGDIEHAERLRAQNRRSFFGAQILRQRRWLPQLSRSVAAQLARDLQLTLRVFSSVVYVAAGLSVLWMLMLLATLTTDLLPLATTSEADVFSATWHPAVIAVKVACVAAVISLGALLPVLVSHELPHFWLERAVGTTGREMYEAKLWYTRLVSLPAALLTWCVGALSGHVEWFYVVPLLLECVWLWWLVSSLMGALSFEMPTRPGLAVILMITAAGAVGLVTALLWPLGLALYAYGIAQLTHRGYARAKYLLLTGGD